jgi:hypothetical protein
VQLALAVALMRFLSGEPSGEPAADDSTVVS